VHFYITIVLIALKVFTFNATSDSIRVSNIKGVLEMAKKIEKDSTPCHSIVSCKYCSGTGKRNGVRCGRCNGNGQTLKRH
jgi:DnaJ-class molecular chaperone